MQLGGTIEMAQTLRLDVAGREFEAEITEIEFSDGPALVASTPPSALNRAHKMGQLPKILGCPCGYRAVPIMLSEPERHDVHQIRVPWSWELIRTEQGGAAR